MYSLMNLLKNLIKDWVIPIGIALIIALIIRNFVIFNITVPTESMFPTIKIGDKISVTKGYRHKFDHEEIPIFSIDLAIGFNSWYYYISDTKIYDEIEKFSKNKSFPKNYLLNLLLSVFDIGEILAASFEYGKKIGAKEKQNEIKKVLGIDTENEY